ncbi:hypothetical protein GGS20DRAFT_581193 [Poronia punctata]|nr:hypothetical protein GGS20DRAFT_581193 [Poronia punctata]
MARGRETWESASSSLPQYAPLLHENLGWYNFEAGAGLREPVRLVLEMAEELCDYEIQDLALTQLIRLSKDAYKKTMQLYHLHKS